MCGTAMPQVNSDANTPPGHAGLMQLLADDHRVGAVAATAADRFGQARAQQARPPRRAGAIRAASRRCVPTRRRAARSRVRRTSAPSFAAARAPAWSRCSQQPFSHSSTAGMSTWRLRSHSPSPLACGSNRAW